MQTKQNASKYQYFACAFAIPFALILMVMIVDGCSPFGDRSFLYSDMYHQYYPFFVEFRRSLLSGDSLLYNWSVGMGMDYLSLIAYYLASPLNLLCMLVPESLTLELFSLLMPIKLGLASLFFSIFLYKTFGKNDLSISLFGGMYGLCAWALGYQWNIMWLDGFMLLPLMTLGTVELLRDKKFVLYTVILFLSVASNYYVGFFVCIFVLLLFICWQVCRWQGFGRFLADFFRIGVFTLIAIGMTVFLELPALAGLQNTQSSVNSFPKDFRLNIASEHTLKGLLEAMGKVTGNLGGGVEITFKEGLPNVYCGVGTVILAVLFLTGKEIKLRDKLMSVLLLVFFTVSFIIRQLDYIWHGMHFTNMIPYRFSFLYSFVLLYMAYRAYLQRSSFRAWHMPLATGAVLGMMFLSQDLTEIPYLAFNLSFCALYIIALFLGIADKEPAEDAPKKEWKEYTQKTERKQQLSTMMLLTVFAVELIANIVNFGVRFPTTGVSNYPKGTDDAQAVFAQLEELEKGNPFYRVETTHSQTLNDGALNGYNGVSTFTSSANVKNTLFLQALGYGAKNTYNRYCYEESSPVANLFLGVKYMIDRDSHPSNTKFFQTVYAQGSVRLMQNQAYLPLGFLVDNDLSQLEWDAGSDRFGFQNRLFSTAIGLEGEVWHMVGNYTITAEGVTLKRNDGSWYCSYGSATSGSSITYEFTADREGMLCLDLDVSDRNSYTVSKNGQKLYSETMSLPQMIAAADVVTGDTIQVKLTCKDGEDGSMTVKAAILDEEFFSRGYELLSAAQLELTDFRNTHIRGTIECDRNGLLYTSIPYDGNWKVAVDGVAVEPTLVGDVMTGVYLSEGSHAVEFTYRNEAFSYGWKISLACAMCFVIALLVYKPNEKKGKYEK